MILIYTLIYASQSYANNSSVASFIQPINLEPKVNATEVNKRCERKFKTVRNKIFTWIEQGGYLYLHLPADVRTNDYKKNMFDYISSAKVTCTDDIITVGEATKTCRNQINPDGTSFIICNAKKFLETDPSEQYVLVHHEYASLAGFETSTGEESHYLLSDQIAGFTKNEVVTKLSTTPVNKGSSPAPAPKYIADNEKDLCKGHLCRIVSIQLDNQCKLKTVILHPKVSRFLDVYFQSMINHKDGNDPTFPAFTPAEQIAILFSTTVMERIGKTYGDGTCNIDSEENNDLEDEAHPTFIRVETKPLSERSQDRVVSVYVDKSVYHTLTIYLDSLVNSSPGEDQEPTNPAFTPAEQYMILLYTTMMTGLKNGKTKTTVLDKVQYDSTVEGMNNLINTTPGESPVYPEFTSAGKSVLLYVSGLFDPKPKQ